MKELLITVLTPTYNRGEQLRQLFASLQAQTCMNFQWLVVDDGSTDNTRQVVAELTQQATFPVRYLYQANGGKHTALNRGVPTVDTPLTFIVDSDDTVTPDAAAWIETYYAKYREDAAVGVFSFLRYSHEQGVILKMPCDECIGTYVSERVRAHRPGDMAEVFRTEALQAFPFPQFTGERFLSEDVVWIPMSLSYKSVFINRAIYGFDYLPDGLTRNDKRHKFASPLGSMLRGKVLMHRACGLIANIRGAILYDCYRYAADAAGVTIPASLLSKTVREKVLTALMHVPARFYYRKWKQK